jgi:hypothetical protein
MHNLCIFAHYDRDGIVDPYVLHYLDAIRACDFEIVLVTTAKLGSASLAALESRCLDVIIRDNVGHDFGSWSVGLAYYRDRVKGRLLIANDSVYGPIGPMQTALDRLTSQPADFYGMVYSQEIVPHLQSWFLLFEPHVAASEAFAEIFCQRPMHRSKTDVIRNFELKATAHLQAAGFVARALHTSGMRAIIGNPTAYLWRELIEQDGVPFMKVAILRDNPVLSVTDDEWHTYLLGAAPEVCELVDAHLRRVRAGAPAKTVHRKPLQQVVRQRFLKFDDTFARLGAPSLVRVNSAVHSTMVEIAHASVRTRTRAVRAIPRPIRRILKLAILGRDLLGPPTSAPARAEATTDRDAAAPIAAKLIWFLVPSEDIVTGGLMSICSIYSESLKIFAGADTEVIASTYPGFPPIRRYTKFPNDCSILTFDEALDRIGPRQEIILHVPEYYCRHLVAHLPDRALDRFHAAARFQVNILLQNIEMIEPADVRHVCGLTPNVTCTTAHEAYSTKAQSDRLGITLHRLSVFKDKSDYPVVPYLEKRDRVVVSPDPHPMRNEVLARLARERPDIEQVVVENMRYEDYLALVKASKWSLTFGEGLDWYLAEMAWCGGVPFAVFNSTFFPPNFAALLNVYRDWDACLNNLIDDIARYDNPAIFETASAGTRALLDAIYSNEVYRRNLRNFYQGAYTFPRSAPPLQASVQFRRAAAVAATK